MDASSLANCQMTDTVMPRCTDARTDCWASWSRAGGILFGVLTQIIFIPTVYYVFLFLRDGVARPAGGWMAIDCLLTVQFVVPHSILLLPRVRSAVSRIVPIQFYGSLFAVSTCIGLWVIFGNWRSSSILIWEAQGWSRIALRAGFYASWILLIYSMKLVGLG